MEKFLFTSFLLGLVIACSVQACLHEGKRRKKHTKAYRSEMGENQLIGLPIAWATRFFNNIQSFMNRGAKLAR